MFFPPPELQPPLVPGPPLHAIPLARLVDRPIWGADGRKNLADTLLPSKLEGLQADVSRERQCVPSNLDGSGYSLILFPPEGFEPAMLAASDEAGRYVACIGVLCGLAVQPAHRGHGIARELMIAAFALGVRRADDEFALSPGGRAALASAHRHAVHRAIEAGLDVTDEILADYPDLGDRGARTGYP